MKQFLTCILILVISVSNCCNVMCGEPLTNEFKTVIYPSIDIDKAECIIIPKNITYIPTGAFKNNLNLKEIYFEGHDYPGISPNCLPDDRSNIVLYYNDWAIGFSKDKWIGVTMVQENGTDRPQPFVDWTNMTHGSVIEFGKINGQPIKWYVVEMSHGKCKLFSKDIICEKEFNSNNNDWENSDLRNWLNSDAGFLCSENFTDEEKNAIVYEKYESILTESTKYRASKGTEVFDNCAMVTMEGMHGQKHIYDYNDDVNIWDFYSDALSAAYTNDLTDKVYLPREDEVNLFAFRDGYYTEIYAKNLRTCDSYPRVETVNNYSGGAYWLRSPYTGNGYQARCIDENTNYSRFDVNKSLGVRPILCLDTSKLQIVGGIGTVEEPIYLMAIENLNALSENFAYERFEENGLYGYKDKDGNVIVPAKYLKAWEFSEGAALVVLPEDPYRLRYIDTEGNYLFDKAFYASNNFNNGYALVLAADDSKYSYIDKTGKFATKLLFDDAEDFCGGYARVCLDGKWGVIDTNFNFKVPCEYDSKDEVLGKLDLE